MAPDAEPVTAVVDAVPAGAAAAPGAADGIAAALPADASVGTNGAELARVGLPKPIAIVARRDSDEVLAPLVNALIRAANRK